jgi:hypothetical protein
MRSKKFAGLSAAAAMVGALLTVLSPTAAQAAEGTAAQASGPGTLASTCCYRYRNEGGKFLGSSNGTNVIVDSNGLPWTEVPDGSYVTLWYSSANKNLGLAGNRTASGTGAVLTSGSSNYTQDWKRNYLTDTKFQLKSRANTGMCLGISGGSSGTNVAIFPCANATNQLWTR